MEEALMDELGWLHHVQRDHQEKEDNQRRWVSTRTNPRTLKL